MVSFRRFGHGGHTGAQDFRQIGAAEKCHGDDRRGETRNPDADARQCEINEKQLDEQRRIACQFDVQPYQALENGYFEHRDGGVDQGDAERGCDGDQPDLQGDTDRDEKRRQCRKRKIDIKTHVDARIGERPKRRLDGNTETPERSVTLFEGASCNGSGAIAGFVPCVDVTIYHANIADRTDVTVCFTAFLLSECCYSNSELSSPYALPLSANRERPESRSSFVFPVRTESSNPLWCPVRR